MTAVTKFETDPRLIGKLYTVLSTRFEKWQELPTPFFDLLSHDTIGLIQHQDTVIYLGTVYDVELDETFAKVIYGDTVGLLSHKFCRLLQLPWIDYHGLPSW